MVEHLNNQLLLGGVSAQKLIDRFGSPLYVYEEDTLRGQIRLLNKYFSQSLVHFHYAMKANFNPAILKIVLEEGFGVDTVSPYEIQLALSVGFKPAQIIFTGNNVRTDELEYCVAKNILINFDSLTALQWFGEHYPGRDISVRINPGIGSGHHEHCITGGPRSKFGVYFDQIPQLQELLERYQLKLVGVHSHIGTGILESEPMLEAMSLTLNVARQFKSLQFIDLGGGFGIPYREGESGLDVQSLAKKISVEFENFCQDYGRPLQLHFEPGRFCVASSGWLLAVVNTLKHTPQFQFVGVDTGFNHLVRPTMYGSYHRIFNATRMDGEIVPVLIAGNICETGDVFTQDEVEKRPRDLPRFQVGDVLAIADTGAYGMSMSSQYNLRARPAEVLVNQGHARLIRQRESFADLGLNFVDEKVF